MPSRIFAGTQRKCSIYLPPDRDPKVPSRVMIFLDGSALLDPKGLWQTSSLLDRLIRDHRIPSMIGIFIDAGSVPLVDPVLARDNRGFEYESNSDQFARFLTDEVLPTVGKTYLLSDKAADRGVCGIGAGGLAALTVAWQRPEYFGRVISFVDDLSSLRGGERYADAFRECEPKPLRIAARHYSGSKAPLPDINGELEVESLARAMDVSGTSHYVVPGTLGMDAGDCRAAISDAMTWLWQDSPSATQPAAIGPPALAEILLPAEPWRAVAGGFAFTEGPIGDSSGNVYFTDTKTSRILKLDSDEHLGVFASDTGGADGLAFGPDGRIYACQLTRGRVVCYDTKDARETLIADGIEGCNDLTICPDGGVYVTQPPQKRVWYISPVAGRPKSIVSTGIAFPNGIAFTPDFRQVVVADTHGANCYLFKVLPDMTLGIRAPYFTLALPGDQADSGADGVTFDSDGRLYVASRLGLQVFDTVGHRIGIIDKPHRQWLSNVKFAGRNWDTLYATCGDKLFARKTRVRGTPPISTTRPTRPTLP